MGMSGFTYRGGVLCADELAVPDIAEDVGTPFYCYSANLMSEAYLEFAAALDGLPAEICYAVKANDNQAVISLFAGLGAGADVVSEGELRRALAAGIPAARIVFSGVGKTSAEITAALKAGCGQFNVESEAELDTLAELAASGDQPASVAIRVNPDVDAGTHHKISTGRAGDKFGIESERVPEIYRRARDLPGIEPVGLAVHIGSQLTKLDPFRAAFRQLALMVSRLRNDGFAVERLDLGGGLGVVYRNEARPPLTDYAALVREIFAPLDVSLTFEPGRRLTAEAGILVSRVIRTKESGGRRFAIVDAAMNDLIRPTLYDAWHDIHPVREPDPRAETAPLDIVGPICETGDVIAAGRALPPLQAGDLIAIRSAGAYGAVMSSAYNCRLPAPEVMVDGDRLAVIRPRICYTDLISADRVPDWITRHRA